MARGQSGRIVLEINPSEKDDLYAALKKDGMTLKEWFLGKASQYLRDREQPMLFAEQPVDYKVRPRGTKKKASKHKQNSHNQ